MLYIADICKLGNDRRQGLIIVSYDFQAEAVFRRNPLLLPDVPHTCHHSASLFKCLKQSLIDIACLRETLKHYGLAIFAVADSVPEFFRNERHYRVHHLEQLLEESYCCIVGGGINRRTVSWFHEFQVPGAEIVPEEFVNRHQGIGNPELGEMVVNHCHN